MPTNIGLIRLRYCVTVRSRKFDECVPKFRTMPSTLTQILAGTDGDPQRLPLPSQLAEIEDALPRPMRRPSSQVQVDGTCITSRDQGDVSQLTMLRLRP
jgi:hypothetical protein